MKTEDLALFSLVAKHLSLTGAARDLNIPVSKVCRNISNLEQHLGTRLMERTTRSLILTDAGIELQERSRKILADVEDLEMCVGTLQSMPEGKVTIAAPLDSINMNYSYILQLLRELYPKLKLKFISYQSYQNPMDIKADLVFFISHTSLPDSSLVAQQITSARRVFIASPDFIIKHPQLIHPRQLVNYPCLLSAKGSLASNVWLWTDTDNTINRIEVDGPLESDAIDLCISAAVYDAGIAWVPISMCNKKIESGELQLLFDGQYSSVVNFWGVYPSRHHIPYRVKLVLDFFRKNIHLATD